MELWKNELRRKINGNQWIDAIEFMKEIIYNNPESEDAYLNYYCPLKLFDSTKN